MSNKADAESRDDIAYIDLTNYDGPWPPPRDYGLTEEQYEKLDTLRQSRPFRGRYVWLLPLLALVIPNDIYSMVPPLAWLIHVLEYVFPVLRVVGHASSDGEVAQSVFGLALLGALLYMPYNLKGLAWRMRTGLNLNRYSFLMIAFRPRSSPRLSPRSYRQAIVWFWPLVALIFAWLIISELAGYVAIYLLEIPVLSVAHWNMGFGIASGCGWLHNVAHAHVSSSGRANFFGSRVSVVKDAYVELLFFITEFAVLVIIYQFHSIGGLLRWKKQLVMEDKHITKMLRERKKAGGSL